MAPKENHGFTLIELLVVIAIISVFSLTGVYLMIYMVQQSIFIPRQLNTDMIGSQALDMMVEGDQQAKGLRFSRTILSIQTSRVDFTNQEGLEIRYRVNSSKLERRIINAGAGTDSGWVITPYYQNPDVIFQANPGPIFTYYDTNENILAAISGNQGSVRRIAINFVAKTNTGSFVNWEGSSKVGTSVAIKQF